MTLPTEQEEVEWETFLEETDRQANTGAMEVWKEGTRKSRRLGTNLVKYGAVL